MARRSNNVISVLAFRLTVLGNVCLAASACGDQGSGSLYRAVTLERVRTVVRQDATPETSWLSRPSNLIHDSTEDRLLTLDRDRQRVLEFTTSGEFVREYGRRGEGPGEMRNVKTAAAVAGRVVVLDQGNRKIVVFDRATAQLALEIPLRNQIPQSMAVIGDSLLAVVPGPDGALFELVSPEGDRRGQFGDGGFLAGGYPGHLVAHIGDERLVVVKPSLPEGRIYRLDGSPVDIFVFSELSHVLSEWRDQFTEKVRRRMGSLGTRDRGRIVAGRLYFTSIGPTGDGSFFLVAPPENLDVEPWEVWILDHRGQIRRRYAFDQPWIGRSTASFPRIYATGQGDQYGIFEYRIP